MNRMRCTPNLIVRFVPVRFGGRQSELERITSTEVKMSGG
jgi:hypothetical protein